MLFTVRSTALQSGPVRRTRGRKGRGSDRLWELRFASPSALGQQEREPGTEDDKGSEERVAARRGCMDSSAPHLLSLTVGEWSPEGLSRRPPLPPVRERQTGGNLDSRSAGANTGCALEVGKGSPSASRSCIPGEGSRRQRGGLKPMKSTSYSGLKRGLRQSRESFSLG